MSNFLNERISALSPYTPGEQPKDMEYIKLNTNESPFPPSKLGIELAMGGANISHLYPDPDCTELTKAVAEFIGVNKENVIMVNGSDEVLNFAFMAYCDDKTPAVFADITYGFYKVFAALNGVPTKIIPLKADFSIDIDDYIKENGTIFIANPNAPTGLLLSLSEIEKLISSNPNRVVVIDEAYVDFGGISAVKLIEKYDNLLVTQTFSKSRSLAGARLGFGVASKKIIDDLMRIKYSTNPYNVNRASAGLGLGAILDEEYFTKQKLIELGFSVTDSKANFLFAKTDKISGKELYLKLKENGVLVRHFDSPRISDYIRITIGSREQMQKFIEKTTKILEEI